MHQEKNHFKPKQDIFRKIPSYHQKAEQLAIQRAQRSSVHQTTEGKSHELKGNYIRANLVARDRVVELSKYIIPLFVTNLKNRSVNERFVKEKIILSR